MKLSEKGLDKVYGLEFDQAQGFPVKFEDIEFVQSDFQGAVVLTVEEAKKWMRILHENAPYLDCLYESSKDDYLFLEEISKRIEQAEEKE